MLATVLIIVVGTAVLFATTVAVISIGRLEEEQPSDNRGANAFSEFDPLATPSGRHPSVENPEKDGNSTA